MTTRFRGPVALNGGVKPVASMAYLNTKSYTQDFAINITSFVCASITSATSTVTFNAATADLQGVRTGLAQALYLLQQKRFNEGTTTD